MNQKKIGVENFRVFKDYTEFEIRPITLLTGPNNSGKSSFTKLLLLLKNTMNNLDFSNGKHNLVDFDQIRNWESLEEKVTIKVGNTIPFLDQSLYTEIEYEKGGISSLRVKSSEIALLSISFDKMQHEYMSNGDDHIQTVNIDIEYLLKLIYEQEILVPYLRQNPGPESEFGIVMVDSEMVKKQLRLAIEEDGFFSGKAQREFHKEMLKKVTLENLRDSIENKVQDPFDDSISHLYRNAALSKAIKSCEKDFLLYEIYCEGRNISMEYIDWVRELQRNIFGKLNFHFNIGSFVNYENHAQVIKDLVERINTTAKRELVAQISNKLGKKKEEISISESSIGYLLFKEKLFNLDLLKGNYYKNSIFEEFAKISFSLSDYLAPLHYISPTRGSHKRVLANQAETEIDSIILEFYNTKNKNLEYLKKIFSILEIEGNLEVERHENFVSIVSMENQGKKVALHNLGYGYSQVIPIILKIIILAKDSRNENILIIEEPEANLHPNLQSKLADVLEISLKFFPNLNFIIETHSEYLIRKLQYLTAKKVLSPDHSVIYYFNSDKYVSREEPKVKKIEITPTGNLTDTFGPGFYDEATRLKFDLMKINQEQNN